MRLKIKERYLDRKIEFFMVFLVVFILDILLFSMFFLAILVMKIEYIILFILLSILLIKLSLMVLDDINILKVKESVWTLTNNEIIKITVDKNLKLIEKIKIPYSDLKEIKIVKRNIVSNKKDIFILIKENSKTHLNTKQRVFFIQPSYDHANRDIINFVNEVKEKMVRYHEVSLENFHKNIY